MRAILIDADTGKRVFTRKEVAKICGVSPQTIRLWEDASLIPLGVRDDNGYRYWDEDTLKGVQSYANISLKERRRSRKEEARAKVAKEGQ